MSFFFFSENEFFHRIKRDGITSLHGIHEKERKEQEEEITGSARLTFLGSGSGAPMSAQIHIGI